MQRPAKNNLEKVRKVKIISFEFILALAIVLIMSGGIDRFYSDPIAEQLKELRDSGVKNLVIMKSSEGNMHRMAVLVCLYFFIMTYLVMHWRALLPVLRRGFPFLCLAIMSIASTLWSIDPQTTFIRSCSLFLATMTGFYFAMRYSPPEFCELVGRCLLFLCIFEFCTVVLDPGYAIHHGKFFPAVRGYFGQKNLLGNTMIMSFLFSLFLLHSGESKKWGLSLLFFSLMLIVLSLSRTSWLITALVFSLYVFLILLKKYRYKGALFVAVIITCSVIIWSVLVTDQEILVSMASSIGRDSTLTGRTQIWSGILKTLMHGPLWFGFGYEAFWTSSNGAKSYLFNHLGFVPFHAHNGWIQIMTHLGVIGAILVTIPLIYGIIKNVKYAFQSSDLRNSSGILFLIFFAILNIPESYLIAPERLYWQVFIFYVSNLHGNIYQKSRPCFQQRDKDGF